MTKALQQQVDNVLTLARSVFVDFPLAGMQWGLGTGKEAMVTEAAWRGYDAGVRLATAAIDNLYRLPLTAEILAHAAPALLRWQRLTNAVTGMVCSGLWHTVSLPTVAETRALQDAVARLAVDLHAQHQEHEALISVAIRIAQALEGETPMTLPSAFKGFVLNEQLLHPKAKPTAH